LLLEVVDQLMVLVAEVEVVFFTIQEENLM
jgi:hypothetical protein